MRFRRSYFSVLLFVAALFWGCNPQKSDSGITSVVIISTNDIHAQIDKFPRFASFVKQQRMENSHVLVVDGGDRFSGNVYVDNALEKGKPMISLMNKVGYDVAAFGNHDFDYGQATLKERIAEADFPIICANIQAEGSVLGQPAAYTIVEEAGIRFCFFSLIQTGGESRIPATNPANLEGIQFRYFGDVIEENKNLRSEGDVLVGLTHLGFSADSVLAVRMPELDVIIGGHSHTLVSEPKFINNVLVTQTGSNLKYAGITRLDFQGKNLVSRSFQVVKLDTVGSIDSEVAKMLEEICNRPEFQEKIGETSRGLKYKENVASLVTDAMCEAASCDFVFYNKGGIRLNSIAKGDITKETVYKIEPFSNYIVTHELTLKEMKDLILNRFNSVKNPDKRNIDLYVSEGRYTILKNEAGDGIDVAFVDKNGKKLREESRKYKIGLSNYVSSTYNFTGKGKGNNTGISIVDAVIAFVKEQQDVNYDQRRTFIVKK